jgi:AAA family ATP:ADP antiporter
MPPTSPPSPRPGPLGRLVDVRPAELVPLLVGVAYYFFLLSGYYVLRPIRETFGITWGTGNLPLLFYGTVGVMLLVNPVYSRLVARLPRSRAIPLVHHTLVALLVGFYAGVTLLEDPASQVALKYAFYIFISVFNLFIVSIFWSLMSDLFDRDQARRLYGPLAVGGSLGALFGSFLTGSLVDVIGTEQLIPISCVLLEAAVVCALAFNRRFAAPAAAAPADLAAAPAAEPSRAGGRPDEALGGSAFAGMTAVLRSPYLLGIGGYLLLYGLSSTFAYFFQAGVVSAASADDAARTRIFADIDFYTNAVTLVLQGLVFARLLRWLGPVFLLVLLPVYSAAGFWLLSSGAIPAGELLLAFGVFQVLRRAIGYGLKKPAQELLFTAVTPEEKYKAKNLIDLAFSRAGDMLGARASSMIEAAQLGLLALAGAAAPVSLLWGLLGVGLGLGYRRRLRRSA